DVLGTGKYSAEYLVATKQFWDVDVTLGMGWGRLSQLSAFPNPLRLISSSFKTRLPSSAANGGTVNFGQLFHGARVGVFGGAVWKTPLDGLSVLAEYSTDHYDVERLNGGPAPKGIPFNFGLAYQPIDSIVLTGGLFYGSTYGFTITVRGD